MVYLCTLSNNHVAKVLSYNQFTFLNVFAELLTNEFTNGMFGRVLPALTHWGRDILKYFFLNENIWIPINILLKFVPKGPINNAPTLVQIMAWRCPGNKPLSEPVIVSLLMHISLGLNELILTMQHCVDSGLVSFIRQRYFDALVFPRGLTIYFVWEPSNWSNWLLRSFWWVLLPLWCIIINDTDEGM